MADGLKKLVTSMRKIDTRVTKENAKSMINEMNKYSEDFGFEKIPKSASIKEVKHAKKIYMDRLGYDLLVKAVEEGNTVIAGVYNRDFKNSDDSDTRKLAEYAEPLAQAKKQSDKHLTKEERTQIDRGNFGVLGYGVDSIITKFEATKSKKGVESLIDAVATQDPKQKFYDSQLETFKRTFLKVGVTRADDIEKLMEKLKGMSMDKLFEHTTELLKTLERFYNGNEHTGRFKTADQELANARLDDMLIQLGISKSGKRAVNKTYKEYDIKVAKFHEKKKKKNILNSLKEHKGSGNPKKYSKKV